MMRCDVCAALQAASLREDLKRRAEDHKKQMTELEKHFGKMKDEVESNLNQQLMNLQQQHRILQEEYADVHSQLQRLQQEKVSQLRSSAKSHSPPQFFLFLLVDWLFDCLRAQRGSTSGKSSSASSSRCSSTRRTRR